MLPLLCALLAVYPSHRLRAQSAADLTNAGALFLLLPVGAEAVGMGQAAMTLDGRGEAVFWNPAGLATMESSEFGLSTANLAAGPATSLTLFFPRRGIGVFGGAVYLLDFGEVPEVDSSGTTIGQVASRNIEYLASFATQLAGAFSFGISYKLVQFTIDCSGVCSGFPNGTDALTHGFDVGGQFALGPEGALRLGVAVKNIGFKLQVNNRDQADPLPAHLVVGALYRINFRPRQPAGASLAVSPDSGANGLAAALDRVDLRIAADLDTPWDNSAPPQMRTGIDLGYRELVRLRVGYAFTRQGLSGPSVGMGIKSGSIGVDFARTFLAGSDLVTDNPTYISFRVVF